MTLCCPPGWSFGTLQPGQADAQCISKVESSLTMEKAFSAGFAPSPIFTRRAAARAALVGLNDSYRALLAESFRQFNIETVPVTVNPVERLHKEKFEACVVALAEGTDAVLESMRSSPSNSRCIVYGVGGSSIEMSSGGMSVKSSEDFSHGTNVEISFALMTLPRVNLRGAITWRKPKSLGVRFDPADDRRFRVKSWIDSYLEN